MGNLSSHTHLILLPPPPLDHRNRWRRGHVLSFCTVCLLLNAVAASTSSSATTVIVNAFEWNLLCTVDIKYGPNLHYWALLLLLLEKLTQFNLITPIYLFGKEQEGIQGESTQWLWVFLQLQ